jgi:hypothetical protein
METLPPRKTLNGKFDAYCHVCWLPAYSGWVDDVSPEHDKCAEADHHTAQTCPYSVSQAGLKAFIAKMRREGHLPAPPAGGRDGE